MGDSGNTRPRDDVCGIIGCEYQVVATGFVFVAKTIVLFQIVRQKVISNKTES